MISLNPRHWFQKKTSDFAVGRAEESNRSHFNALYALDPDVLVSNLVAFESGSISGFERILEEFELREDKMRTGSFKMSAAVASKPWEVRILKGEEENKRATLHRDVLTKFWNRIRVTDAFCRSRVGGFRLLVKQMMTAQSRVYAVHDIVWNPLPNGELEATFTFVPAWNFENRTGALRFLPSPYAYDGVEMRPGEWMITVGEGIGIAAAILAMGKRLSWNDWLLFSEKCGMPVVIGNTAAKQDTPAWKSLLSAITAIAPKTGILADMESKLQAVQIGGSSGQSTYRELVDTVDRAISALYRGGDLATVSSVQGQGTGSNAQDGESELMDGDGCAMIAETLNRQVERFVIRYTCGDLEPLAGVVINPPPVDDDVDRNIKIDQHLGDFGVKLSKKDLLSRYGRVEAQTDADAAVRQQTQPGFGGLPNERHSPDVTARGDDKLLAAFAKDVGPLADAVKELLNNPSKSAAEDLLKRLPSLLPDDPEMATVIAEAMAEEFGITLANTTDEPEEQLSLFNEDRESNGRFAIKGTGNLTGGKIENSIEKRQRECREALDAYNASTDHPSVDDIISGKISIEEALKKGFEAKFGGQRVIFFTQQKIGDKYHGRDEGARLTLIRHALAVRNNMFPVNHEGDQIGVVERWTQANSNHRFVITADKKTGVAVNIMRCSDAYIKNNYKK